MLTLKREGRASSGVDYMKVDVFISYASEDKQTFVRPLAAKLADMGFEVWYDEFSLKVGDSLTESIDSGLTRCRRAIVVLSPAFLGKKWPRWELNGIVQRHVNSGGNFIIPILYQLSVQEVADVSPSLADIFALRSDEGVDQIASLIGEVIANDRDLQDLHDVQEVKKIMGQCDLQWERLLKSFTDHGEAVQARNLVAIQNLPDDLRESLGFLLQNYGPFVVRNDSFIGINEFYNSGSFVTYDSLAPLWTGYTVLNRVSGKQWATYDYHAEFGRYLLYESDSPIEEWSDYWFGGISKLWAKDGDRLRSNLLISFSLESLVDERSGCGNCSNPMLPYIFDFYRGFMNNIPFNSKHPYMILGYCPGCDTPGDDFRCSSCGIHYSDWKTRSVYETRFSMLWETACPGCLDIIDIAETKTPWKEWRRLL